MVNFYNIWLLLTVKADLLKQMCKYIQCKIKPHDLPYQIAGSRVMLLYFIPTEKSLYADIKGNDWFDFSN